MYDAKVIECADLNGDDSDEMVVQLLERDVPLEDSVDLPRPWAIYASDGEKWTPALIRSHVPGAEVTVRGRRGAGALLGLVEGDLLCCPTGRRGGVVRWDGNRFTYHPEVGPEVARSRSPMRPRSGSAGSISRRGASRVPSGCSAPPRPTVPRATRARRRGTTSE